MEFLCDRGDCGKTFINKNGLIKHLRLHDNDVIKCFFCPWVTGSPNEHQPHLDHHFNTAQYKCEKCPRTFFRKISLDRHFEISHEVIKDKYKCEICDFKTCSKNNYFQHLRTHRK